MSYRNRRLLAGEDGMALGEPEFVVRNTQEPHLASLRVSRWVCRLVKRGCKRVASVPWFKGPAGEGRPWGNRRVGCRMLGGC